MQQTLSNVLFILFSSRIYYYKESCKRFLIFFLCLGLKIGADCAIMKFMLYVSKIMRFNFFLKI